MALFQRIRLLTGLLALCASYTVHADIRPDSHAPIAVMGEHTHNRGEWMFSYRYMAMDMAGNLQGKNSVSPEHIVSTLSNPNSPPPTVRVVPTSMTTDMHMFGLMYAPSDKLTLMAMLNITSKKMDHITYMGMMGINPLGSFTTESDGLGDSKLSALWRLYKANGHSFHLNMGLSLPTGSINEEDTVLTPMNTRPILRLPYAMQLGSGTYDIEAGATYSRLAENAGWGIQYIGISRINENDEGYALGNTNSLTGWGSVRFSSSTSGSFRLSYDSKGSISGYDPMITAPVQSANPDNYGGDTIKIGIGINFVTHSGHRFAFEYETPIEQDVNGVQMEMDSMLTLGYQLAF